MEDRLKQFFNKKYTYAVVGASNNETKYGYKIYETLKKSGFKVIPINPKEEKIQEDKCYKNLSSYKGKIDVVDFVVPAGITMKVLNEITKLKIDKVWFQPSSFDNKCELFAKKNKIKYLKDFCLMKEALNNVK